MENLAIKIGERIRELRNLKGMNQEELAYRIDKHYTFIGKIERGEKKVSLERLFTITQVLEISLEEFFSKVDPKVIDDNNILSQVIDLLKDRSIEEQSKYLDILKTFTEMLDQK
ncbi:helix-turn-helix transcriptional regulator [Neobacillus sp. 179-C4.2 HS]|uniref:Helix-turn-helix transcriptional regulator n=1 Tax=Neobacillus driksii TaxID=3035913 RepID=A0ABV4YRJ7_9BACI|nr:helix-turn-helix transcriptional regulator [Neobacillus sp. 179.-C4.2 HS]MDP5195048.1 helix-turn-helix transcriptional regulator [Neobacillus sp. 179.-C4.2 HS]